MNLEDRIKRRLLLETGTDEGHASEIASILDPDQFWAPVANAARIAALEAEDTANPIAATAVARQPLTLKLDEDAFRQAIS